MRIYTILVGLVLLVCSCNGQGDISDISLNGNWKVVAYENHETGLVLTKTDANSNGGLDVEISFNDEKTPHEISGVNPPNSFFSTFIYTDSLSIQTSNYGTTKVCCSSEWGEYFISAFDGFSEYEVNEQDLKIYYNNKANSVLFERIE